MPNSSLTFSEESLEVQLLTETDFFPDWDHPSGDLGLTRVVVFFVYFFYILFLPTGPLQ